MLKTTIGPDGEILDTKGKMKSHAKGVDTQGNKWIFHERETQILTSQGDIVTTIQGRFISQGQGDDFNTIIKISLHTIIQPDGEIIIVEDEVDVKCTG